MDSNPEYKEWLLGKLAQRDFLVTRDFKQLILTKELIPENFRSKPTGEIIVEIYQEIMKNKDYYPGLTEYCQTHEIIYPFTPDKDGVDHINIYSKGHTQLGQLLSNFALSPFTHEEFGDFKSVEGFWYWLATGMCDDHLRTLYGFKAKDYGRQLQRVEIDDFKIFIKKAIILKIEQNPDIAKLLSKSDLPFTHYYYYGNKDNAKVVLDDKNYWFVEWIEMMRRYVKGLAHKVIVAGSRSITDYKSVKRIIECSPLEMIEVVSGTAKGVDSLGERYAQDNELPIQRFPADWDQYGKGAGHIRNGEMAKYATALLSIWDGESPGTANMVEQMKRLKKPIDAYKMSKDFTVYNLS